LSEPSSSPNPLPGPVSGLMDELTGAWDRQATAITKPRMSGRSPPEETGVHLRGPLPGPRPNLRVGRRIPTPKVALVAAVKV
jgi:hypothetical protein